MGAFLTKLLGVLGTIEKVFVGFQPIISAAVPGAGTGTAAVVTSDIGTILNTVVSVLQQVAALTASGTSLTQTQITAMIAAAITPIITADNAIKGKTVADPTEFNNGILQVAGGAFMIANSFHADTVNAVTASGVQIKN